VISLGKKLLGERARENNEEKIPWRDAREAGNRG